MAAPSNTDVTASPDRPTAERAAQEEGLTLTEGKGVGRSQPQRSYLKALANRMKG